MQEDGIIYLIENSHTKKKRFRANTFLRFP